MPLHAPCRVPALPLKKQPRDWNGQDCRRCQRHHTGERAGRSRDELSDDNDVSPKGPGDD